MYRRAYSSSKARLCQSRWAALPGVFEDDKVIRTADNPFEEKELPLRTSEIKTQPSCCGGVRAYDFPEVKSVGGQCDYRGKCPRVAEDAEQ